MDKDEADRLLARLGPANTEEDRLDATRKISEIEQLERSMDLELDEDEIDKDSSVWIDDGHCLIVLLNPTSTPVDVSVGFKVTCPGHAGRRCGPDYVACEGIENYCLVETYFDNLIETRGLEDLFALTLHDVPVIGPISIGWRLEAHDVSGFPPLRLRLWPGLTQDDLV